MPVYPDGTFVKESEWNRLISSIPSTYTVYKDGANYRAECNVAGGTDYHETVASTVIQQSIDACSPKDTINFKGSFSMTDEVDMAKALTLVGYGSTFTWTGANTEKSMFKTTSQVDGLRILGGTFLSSYTDVWPLGSLDLKNSIIQDVTVNNTIRTTDLENVVFRNITQLGQYGSAGHDWGINIVGQQVTVDGFYAPLETTYQGGFIINYSTTKGAYNNIVIKNVYVKGDFGSFVHWYIPKNNAQLVGGRTLIEDFYVEYSDVPDYGHFATFPLLDTEGSAGTYSGDFGKVTIRNGQIQGPSQTMVGSVNGIRTLSLADLECNGTDPTVDMTVDNVKIEGMRGFDATTDYLTYNMAGKLILRDISYTGAWEVQLCKLFTTLHLTVENCDIQAGANTIGVSSADSGTSTILLWGNQLSNTVSVNEVVGHTMNLQEFGNDQSVTMATGDAGFFGIEDLVPRVDNTHYLGKFNPKRQWHALYLGSDGFIIWENDAKIERSAANTLEVSAHLNPQTTEISDLGSSARKWKDAYLSGVLKIDGVQVVKEQQVAIADIGGGDADSDGIARDKIDAVLAMLRAHGLIAT